MKKPYKTNYGSDRKPYVDGPGNGLSYESGYLWPELRFASEAEAKRAAVIANIAYAQGYQQAQQDIRTALGLTLTA